jgi:predicted PurR-regulated permease PerM
MGYFFNPEGRFMSDRLKSLLLAFLLSIVLWIGIIAGGAWVVANVGDQLDNSMTAGVR